MFNKDGKPFFDVKTEYHKPYFIALKKIFPEIQEKNLNNHLFLNI